MRKGLTEAMAQAAIGDLDEADLPPKTIAALRLVDCLTGPRAAIDDAVYAAVREHLDEREILDYATAIGVCHGWQRMIEALGIRQDFWSEATPLPWQERPEAQ